MRLDRIVHYVATCCLTLGMSVMSVHAGEAAGGSEPGSERDFRAAAHADHPVWQSFTTANSPLPSDIVTTIAVDRNNVGWIGTWRGLARFDGTTWMTFTAENGFPFSGAVEEETTVCGLAVDSGNTIWAVTPNAVISYDGIRWTKQVTISGFIAQNNDIAVAPNGDIWISCYTYLLRGRHGVWTQYADPYRPKKLSNLAVDHTGAVWVADEDATSIERFDGTTWTSFDRGQVPVAMSHYRSINVDRRGVVWYVDANGVAMFDGAWSKGFPTIAGGHPEFPGARPYWLEIDGRGIYWVGSGSDGGRPGHGLIRYDGARSWYYSVENSRLPAEDLNMVRSGNDWRIWIGTYGCGFAILDGSASPEDIFYSDPRSGVQEEHRTRRLDASLSVRPNPLHGAATARFTLPASGRVRATIVDALGEERTQFDGKLEAGGHELPLDLGDLPDGWYFLRLQAGDAVLVSPVRVLR